jgi:AcrR family transcriptional regulator
MQLLHLTDRKLPTQSRSRERVETILRAAEELLMDNTAPEITTSSISKRAKVPVGSVYQYFKDKDAVLLTLGERVVHEKNQRLAKTFDEVSKHAHWRHVVKKTISAFAKLEMESLLHHKLEKALYNNSDWQQINLRIENQMVDFFANHQMLASRGLPADQARIVVSTIIMISTALVKRANNMPSQQETDMLISELRQMITAYLSQILGD